MVDKRELNGTIYLVSTDVRELYSEDRIRCGNGSIALRSMNDCLEKICCVEKCNSPSICKPKLYLAKTDQINAWSKWGMGESDEIIICEGLISEAIHLINKRFPNDILHRYSVLSGYSADVVRSDICDYLWRFVVLHELYHLWHRHTEWKQKYYFDVEGKIIHNIVGVQETLPGVLMETECVHTAAGKKFGEIDYQKNLTQQALELDADGCAVVELVELMKAKMCSMRLEGKNRIMFFQSELALMFGAISTAFCLFDGNAGAKFESLTNLETRTHPLPSIRMYYAEECVILKLFDFFDDISDVLEAEAEWKKIVCDVEADYNGQVDMGQVFYYPAYTRIAQVHLSNIKRRLADMYDTLQLLALCNFPNKVEEEILSVPEEAIWFDENGNSLHGWTNPATREKSAVRSKTRSM